MTSRPKHKYKGTYKASSPGRFTPKNDTCCYFARHTEVVKARKQDCFPWCQHNVAGRVSFWCPWHDTSVGQHFVGMDWYWHNTTQCKTVLRALKKKETNKIYIFIYLFIFIVLVSYVVVKNFTFEDSFTSWWCSARKSRAQTRDQTLSVSSI